MREEIVEKIKALATTWTPREVHENHLRDIPVEMIDGMFGNLGVTEQSLLPTGASNWFQSLFNSNKRKLSQTQKEVIKGSPDLPLHFDGREQWPGCIGQIRDQMYCGSCWAFSSSGMLGDRFCVQSNGTVNVTLAP